MRHLAVAGVALPVAIAGLPMGGDHIGARLATGAGVLHRRQGRC